jgi:hypothetical protein
MTCSPDQSRSARNFSSLARGAPSPTGTVGILTLAANASVDIRTVQRFEAGQPVSITSRRALAKALGYENPDVFDDPKFIEEVLKFFEELKAMQQKNLDDQHPDHVRIKAQALASGAEAMRFADAVNAMSFDIYDGLADPAKEVAAGFCDYVQELMDLDDFPACGRLGIAKDLDGLLQDLREKGAHFTLQRVTASFVDQTGATSHPGS